MADRQAEILQSIQETLQPIRAENLAQPTAEASTPSDESPKALFPTDKIMPEGFLRGHLDRNIAQVNSYFCQAFGIENGPLQTSVDRLGALGRVALFDVGCGTGNTLRTWAAALQRQAESPDQVTATGVSLHDYSAESRFKPTREAIQSGSINYLVGDAGGMQDVPDESADVVLACMSVFHMRRPELALEEMLRITRPGGSIFFNTKEDQYMSDSPVMERIYQLEEEGHEVLTRIGNVPGPEGNSWDTLFIRIAKPE